MLWGFLMPTSQELIYTNFCNKLITSENTVDIFLPIETNVEDVVRSLNETCVTNIEPRNMIIYTYESNIRINLLERYGYASFPKCYGLMDTSTIEEMGIARLRRQPYFDLYGTNVLIGFVDTGINYADPLFINPDNTTRIRSIWDQTIEDGMNSAISGFGKEYTRADINAALKHENPYSIVPTRDELNHGNFLAAIAAGNHDIANDFSGVATSAEIVMVKLKPAKQFLKDFFLIRDGVPCYAASDIMLGIQYLLNVAKQENRPIVICIGLGSNSGGHEGDGILDHYLDDIGERTGVCVVVATGNESANRLHYRNEISSLEPSPYTDVEFRVGTGEMGFSMELWASPPQLYNIGLISPGGEYFRLRNTRVDNHEFANFIFEGTSVYFDKYVSEPRTGDQLIFMRFRNPAPGVWTVRVFNEDPSNFMFDIWLPVMQFLSGETYFLQSNPNVTITSPGNARIPITVAGYDHITGNIDIASGRGFTRNGRFKPDISAPGVNIFGPAETAGFIRMTGTSIAAAEVAGIAALLLEWGIGRGNRIFMDSIEVKNLLIRGANRTGIPARSRDWGYGKVDIYGVFENLRITT